LDVVLRLLVVAALILANAFFVTAEFALVAVRRTRVEQLAASGSPLARLLQRAQQDPNRFIAAAQLGITMASLALGWVGELTVVELVLPLLHVVPAPLEEAAAHSVAIVVSFAFTSRSASRCPRCSP
jgi:CBS domain containing-hemolysin-like protein